MKRILSLALLLTLVFMTTCSAGRSTSIIDKIETNRGICVVLADAKCELAIELAQKTQLLIYVQLTAEQDLEAARKAVDAAGFYGTRIFVEQGPLDKLYLGDNMADLVIAAKDTKSISKAEVLRVLNPLGKALLGNKTLKKPFPKGVDDWSHPYHGPDNNPQSTDTIARGPYLTQFLAEPRYAPLTQVCVASAGRVFKAFGTIAFKEREEAFLNSLVAFNGYNGTILWRRNLTPGVMVHRNTIIATPDTLYVGDDKSCKLIDTATGRLKDEIIPPTKIAGGTFWKWMGLEDGVLYALTGRAEHKDPVIKQRRKHHGWPWAQVSKGFTAPDGMPDGQEAYQTHPWGFGRNVLAIDPKTKKVLWSHREDEPIDSRAMCMKNGRIYIFRFGSYLACLDAKTGRQLWRKTPANDPELFESLGTYSNRQSARSNWRTTSYLKCNDKALYFAGPQVEKLLAVSAKDGSIMWEYPYNNFQLVLRDDSMYAISGHRNEHPCTKFDLLTGKVLASINLSRRGCTRATGAVDAVFFRANDGSARLDITTDTVHWISPMRPQCHDGVTIANGLLYWWPSTCDCKMTIFGVTCLAPAGNFKFNRQANEADRLQTFTADLKKVATLPQSNADWPTFRANNQGTATSEVIMPKNCGRLWWHVPDKKFKPTAPVAVGGLVFLGGSDGIVRAMDVETGQVKWRAYTAGPIHYPPTIWNSRAFVASADGYLYCYEAKTGRLLWRFRVAPVERRLPVYGTIQSTWPAAAGVLVEDGIAYVAAGIVNYDGTHVYALDAVTGNIKWQNNTSGHLDAKNQTGVSVQGHMLINDGKLYLAGGSSISPAVYDITNGKCLNDPEVWQDFFSHSPSGDELYKVADHVVACGKAFYSHPEYPIYEWSVEHKIFVSPSGSKDVLWVDNSKIVCFDNLDKTLLNDYISKRKSIGRSFTFDYKRLETNKEPLWQHDLNKSSAIAVCKNAVILATPNPRIIALNLDDGKPLRGWNYTGLPSTIVPWGLAIDSKGRVIATTLDGQVTCYGETKK